MRPLILCDMSASAQAVRSKAGVPVFVIACWVLGLMAFAQVLIAGMALAQRFEEAKQVRVIEKEVIRRVVVERTVEIEKPVPVRAAPPLHVPLVSEVLQIEPEPVSMPAAANDKSARLVAEAREARVAGDMGKAIMKLEEAIKQAPKDANVLYEMGLVHEQMGVFDRASEYYLMVYQMGLTDAGALYEIAAKKLSEGFDQPSDMRGKLSLGRVRYFHNPTHKLGERVILTIPVQKGPTEEVSVRDIAVEVRFFNQTSRGDIVELEDPSWVTDRWVTLPFDWAGGEESLRMIYTIPKQDIKTEHLFGQRKYYGQIVTLTYQGEVLDVQAWPRDLAAKITQSPVAGMGEFLAPEPIDSLPSDFDPTIPLLPTLPSEP